MADLKTKELTGVPGMNRNLDYLAGGELPDYKSADIPIRDIPLSEIEERDINEFAQLDTKLLEVSIEYGRLIHPIAVVKREGDSKYKIISGHRRFKAYQNLNKEYPGEYAYIPATAYEITSNPVLLEEGGRYISSDQEEQMYKDANLQSRQLSYAEILNHIDYLIDNIEPKVDSLREKMYRRMNKNIVRNTKGETPWIISDILTEEMKLKGWSKENVRRYIVIKKEAPELINKIKNRELSIYKAYQMLHGDKNEETYKVSKKQLKLASDKFAELKEDILVRGRVLTNQEREDIKKLQKDLFDILG